MSQLVITKARLETPFMAVKFSDLWVYMWTEDLCENLN